ncbi:hypothetical protein LQR30_14085 [Chromobacterium piscinae]|uniref:hypothetical protein n=1 Tax=Chromobacterium piscinae TaxID=686831 RepID=UPI001C8BA31B|nr:hypothetical protein [Chromobacterium piscinae]MBX9298435.1 hypothetical protein [Chromobacterium vaccinii]MBX9359012.1 hypothetical protein [Chromobacterium vaccinii]MCD4505228.1 hypothetical protein [Chromobacterium piscinae]
MKNLGDGSGAAAPLRDMGPADPYHGDSSFSQKPGVRNIAIWGLLSALLLAFSAAAAAAPPTQKLPEPSITVRFDYYPQDLARIRALERKLASAIKRARAGELGETELHLDGNDGFLYLYGPDPDRLYAAAGPILRPSRLMVHAEVTKQYAASSKTFPLGKDNPD